ncbi:DUF4232 domain-containing protein [Streptomyces sp. NPDC048606]|uniref:DUF4232 domain-containing protein n=1 Tax=Streptomyces sp. NPDC048606 TaxID=3154726 RepID=UPI00343027A6
MVRFARTAVPALLSVAVGAALVSAVPAAAAPGAVVPGAAGAPTCAAEDLGVSVGTPDVGAGQLYVPLVFTNVGGGPCTLLGYPGVSVLDADLRRIGNPAERDGRTAEPVRLAPGARATAVLHTTNGPIGGPCLPEGTHLSVYAPASTEATVVDAAFRICSNRFTVGPVTA